MTPIELLALLVLTGWAVYTQTRTTEVTGRHRFSTAVVYGSVGLAVGGFAIPHGVAAVGILLAGLVLSVVVGVARGGLTALWRDEQGRIWRRGNATTVGLFLALVAGKVVLGTVADLAHIRDGAGFGEVLVMIAIMIAMQAEIVRRRAATLLPTAERATVPARH